MKDSSLRLDLVFPRFKILSGAERLVLELSAALARAGHRPRVVCHQFHASCAPLLADGVELVETGVRLDWFGNRYLNAAFDYVRAGALLRRVDQSAAAVLLYGPALRLARGLRSRGTAVVYHCFEPPRALYQDREDVLARAGAARLVLRPALAVYRRVDQRQARIPGALMASGPYAARRVEAVYGRPALPVTHGIDRARLDAPGPKVVPSTLVTVNYLHPRKRVDLAVEALARLSEPLPGESELPTLCVVGDGPERTALEKLATSLGIASRVRFAGFVPETELGAHYRAARAYLHCAREESFGLSVIEAAYCGLPVVAVAEGGVVDNVRDGVTGRLVRAEGRALATAIAEVLADADAARGMGAAGRADVEVRYTWEQGGSDVLRAVAAAQAAPSAL